MLPRSRTLRSEEFAQVITKGIPVHSQHFLVKIQKTGALQSRFSVTVPKKVAKTAVVRNTIRRQVYSVLEKFVPNTKFGVEGIIVLKKPIDDVSFKEIIEEIKGVFLKLSLI